MFTASDVLRHPTLRLVKAVSVLKSRLSCMHATSSTATKPGGVVRGRLASCNLHNWTHCVESCSLLCSHLCRSLKDVVSSHKVTRTAAIRKLRRPQLRSPPLDQRGHHWNWIRNAARPGIVWEQKWCKPVWKYLREISYVVGNQPFLM